MIIPYVEHSNLSKSVQIRIKINVKIYNDVQNWTDPKQCLHQNQTNLIGDESEYILLIFNNCFRLVLFSAWHTSVSTVITPFNMDKPVEILPSASRKRIRNVKSWNRNVKQLQ